jgi:hypothetical protein
MTLLWAKVAKYYDDDEHWLPMTPHREEHSEHALHPAFRDAGIKPSPCGYTLCDDFDQEHSDRVDEAERRSFHLREQGQRAPVRQVDLSTPIYGMENHVDHDTLDQYQADPSSRSHGHPLLFQHGGAHYIIDGHHATAAAMRRGDHRLVAHVIDLDEDH